MSSRLRLVSPDLQQMTPEASPVMETGRNVLSVRKIRMKNLFAQLIPKNKMQGRGISL